MILNILTWCFVWGFIYIVAIITDDKDMSNTKMYKDLNETMLNRNEEV